MITDELFDEIAQNSHWAGGLAFVWGSVCLIGPGALWYSVLAGMAIAAAKEFWYDEKYETTEVRGSSLEDFTYYCVGLIGGALIYFLRWRFLP
jgi:hypothetical protein